ncbi:MAG TPA: hypothetical protein VNU70_08955 [Puia sp.]|jgi:hypothetical protein|nr:hypothetical protein [Puia sp.]
MKPTLSLFLLLACGLFSSHAICQVKSLVKIFPYSQDPGVVTRPGWSNVPYDTTVFLRLVTGGRLNLYTCDDGAGVTYFFISVGNAQPEQLRIQKTLVKKGAETDVLTNDLYRYQLADLVAGCPMVAARPVEVPYEENALSRLISTYNHCGKELAANGKGRLHWNARLVPMAGYVHGSVKISGNTDAAYAGWPTFNLPTGGLGVFLQPTRGRRRLGIQVDALYDHLSLNSGKFQKNYYQVYTGRLDYDELKGNIQLRYQQPVGSARPFIAIGFSNTLIINNQSRQSLYDAGTSQNIRQPLFGSEQALRMYRPGAFVSLGTEMRHWVLEGRFEQTQGLTSLPGVNAPVTNFYVLIGYKL